MVVDKTIIHTQNLDKFLWFPREQRPLVLQLGGSDPATLAAAAAKAAEYGYDEINLNCGCPSDRVAGAGCFGAALMLQPQLVADCMAAMAAAVAAAGPGGGPLPVSVKCRLGVDEADSYAQLHEFVRVVSEGSPVRHFIVHSRKAFLNGLSPHQNRTVPPLRHQWAWALARDFPHLQFSLNGGLLDCHEARSAILTSHPEVPYTRPQLPPSDPRAAAAAVCGLSVADASAGAGARECNGDAGSEARGGTASASASAALESNGGGIEGVMIGRGAYNDPWGCLADADRSVYGEPYNPAPSRRWVIERYREYAEPMVGRWYIKPDGHPDPSIRTLMRPLLNLFHGEPGCKRWKAAVDEVLKGGPTGFGEVLDRTLHLIPDYVLDAPPRQPDLAALPPFQLDPALPSPTSRAGQNQAPPGSKPPRGGGGARGAGGSAAAAAAEAPPAVAAVAPPDSSGCSAALGGYAAANVDVDATASGVAHEKGREEQQAVSARGAAADEAAAAASSLVSEPRREERREGSREDGDGSSGAACCSARRAASEEGEEEEEEEEEAVAERGAGAAEASPRGEGSRGGAGAGAATGPAGTAAARVGGREAVVAAAAATTATQQAGAAAVGSGEGQPGKVRRRRQRGCILS
ncbi:hypothetical protein PLESTF_001314200 [Pleodorina starrii]|nr:hypothetical protein PLESTF_001314200 [Pleodorina starrii]